MESLEPGVVYQWNEEDVDSASTVRAKYRVYPIKEEFLESRNATLRKSDASTIMGKFSCYHVLEPHDEMASCHLTLVASIGRFDSWNGDFFSALKTIRATLERIDLIPLVNGANRNCLVTGLSISMGLGLRAYLAQDGRKGAPPVVVDILGDDAATDPVTVAEQEAFTEEFWRSHPL